MTILIFFILGLIIGSFLNVVVCRLELAESILGRSRCPHCKAIIRWYDNIPLLSFILLKARCRNCQGKISWQYPLVELATGIIFALAGYYFFIAADIQSWAETLFYLVSFSLLITVFVYDLKLMEIPMIVLWIGVIWAVSYLVFLDWASFNSASGLLSSKVISGIIGGGAAFLFFFALSYLSKEKWMGAGDAYAALWAGLIMGWPKILLALMLAFTAGAICGIILIALKKKTIKSQIPFAPFLAGGVILAVFLEKVLPQVEYWYSVFR